MAANLLLCVESTLLLSVAALYIIHCPFNKVEESFNTQAIHDIVNIFPDRLPSHGLQNDSKEIAIRSQLPWDHTQFPGVVPRTFIGALIIGLPVKLAKYVLSNNYFLDGGDESNEHDLTSQFILQLVARFMLSSLLVLSLSTVTQAIHRRYGFGFRICFLLVTVSQFHYMFYAGRFIPNTFASILANLTFASWINRQYSKSFIYIALCVIIFRFDTCLLFGWLIIDGVFIRKFLSIGRVLKVGIPAGLFAIMISFAIDSIFWRQPVWPEFESLHFNVWMNKSHNWGIEPFWWYIYSCLPRLMLSSSPLIFLADHKITREYLIPTLAFILTYSFLPHKELRFILYVTPLLNICVASGMMNSHFYIKRLFSYLRGRHVATVVSAICLIGMLSANLLICFILSRVSSHNYPGGKAAISLGMTKELLDKAQESMRGGLGIHDPRSDVAVYVNNLAAQTGVSRFIQVNGVYYAKTPKLDERTFEKSYTLIYLILEPQEVIDYLRAYCPLEKNQGQLFDKGVDSWKRTNTEIKCNIPNQPLMYCSIIDTIQSFSSVNLGGLTRKIRRIKSVKQVADSLDDAGFIKTRTALHIVRCSTKSKFNPFA